MFRGIHKLPPAHCLVFERRRRAAVRRYWDLAYEPKHERLGGGADAMSSSSG